MKMPAHRQIPQTTLTSSFFFLSSLELWISFLIITAFVNAVKENYNSKREDLEEKDQ